MAVDLHKMRQAADKMFQEETPETFAIWLRKKKMQRNAESYDNKVREREVIIKELTRQLNEGYKFMICATSVTK